MEKSHRNKYKVVHLTSSHRAYDTRVWKKECKSLAEAGYEVVLIAPHDQDENVDGITIRAIQKPSTRKERFFQAPFRVLRAALKERADVYHFHDPELLPAGVILRLLGHRVIYDVHEDVSKDISERDWIPDLWRPVLRRSFAVLDRIASRLFSGVIAATPNIAVRYKHAQQLAVVRNYPVLDELMVTDSPYNDRPNQVAYVGSLGAWRGVREMVRAVEYVNPEYDPLLVIAGVFGKRSLQEAVSRYNGWERVDHRGWCERHEVASVLSRSRCGLSVLWPTESHKEALPVKMFEYMSAGIPVIASDLPLWRDILGGETKCGILVDPMDPQAIAGAINWVFAHPEEAKKMGERGRRATEIEYNWSKEKEKLLALYQGILN